MYSDMFMFYIYILGPRFFLVEAQSVMKTEAFVVSTYVLVMNGGILATPTILELALLGGIKRTWLKYS